MREFCNLQKTTLASSLFPGYGLTVAGPSWPRSGLILVCQPICHQTPSCPSTAVSSPRSGTAVRSTGSHAYFCCLIALAKRPTRKERSICIPVSSLSTTVRVRNYVVVDDQSADLSIDRGFSVCSDTDVARKMPSNDGVLAVKGTLSGRSQREGEM